MKYDFPRLPYQERWNEWSADRRRVGNFSCTGSGKTVMTLDWLTHHDFGKVLVLCPKAAMHHTWFKALKYNFKYPEHIVICGGAKKKRQAQMEDFLKNVDKGVFIINYDLLDKHQFELAHMGFDCAVLDESHFLSNATSKRSKAALKIFNSPAWKPFGLIALTGTPSPRDLFGYYMQMCLITGIQKESFFQWRKNNFNEYTFPNTNIRTYTPREGVKQAILDSVAAYTFTATKDDLTQLPDRVRKVESIPMSPKQKAVYKALMDDFIVNVDGTEIHCDSSGTRATKLLQVSSGFIYDNQQNPIILSHDRTKLMLQHLDSLNGEQCVIWYAYKWQREQICEALGVEAYSECKDKVKYIEDFLNGKNKYFVAHPRSCSTSLTLTNCRYELWYCLSGDLRGWMQACDRVYRLGQEKVVVSTTLQSDDTYDEYVYDGIMKGFDNDKIVMEFFRKESK